MNSALAAEGYFHSEQHIFRSLFSRAVPAPDFESGGAGFQTRENVFSSNDGLLRRSEH
jgi:hypothetical protein